MKEGSTQMHESALQLFQIDPSSTIVGYQLISLP